MEGVAIVRRRSAVSKHSAAAAGSGVSTTDSAASGLKLSAMSSSGHDDATPDSSLAGASAAAATASAGPLDDAVANPDVASVEPGAVSAAGQYHLQICSCSVLIMLCFHMCCTACCVAFFVSVLVKAINAIYNPVVMSVLLSVCSQNALNVWAKSLLPLQPAAAVQSLATPRDVTSYY